MCGICGIIDKRGLPVPMSDIKAMSDRVRHRGPDDEGQFLHQALGLGHRRLSILDLSSAGHQPMQRDQYVIAYNGEIYNYIELRKELQEAGHTFHTGTDTEVVLASYERWGQSCVQHFNGMWSFILFDQRRQLLFCSRDRFGVKPLYYYDRGDRFFLASEIKQLLPEMTKRRANAGKLVDYLVLGLEEYDAETFFQDVQKVQGGHNLIYDLINHAYHIVPYYEMNIRSEWSEWPLDQAVDRYRAELERSVSIRLRSDVRVGTCLSGGLDSSSVAALAAPIYRLQNGGRFLAITAKSVDPHNDETGYAGKLAEREQLDWNVISPGPEEFRSVMDTVIRIQEEPFGSPSIILQYFVMKAARDLGCPVLLDGQGGDETLLGYERYYPAYLLSLKWHEAFAAFLRSTKHSKLNNLRLLAYLFYFPNARIRLNKFVRNNRVLQQSSLQLVNRDFAFRIANSYKNIAQLQELELRHTQLPHLLKYEDRNSMHHSIETRLPFVDYQLVELSLSIQHAFKIREGWTKYVLRQAMADRLPHELAWRKTKIGFEAPMRIWLHDRMSYKNDITSSRLLQQLLRPVYIQRFAEIKDLRLLWKLINIAKWENLLQVEL
jgi:asparagine synthase (glutamine-hydrolysing)